MPRGAKPQRTDLNGAKPLPIMTAPSSGQQYGKVTAQQQSQRILPVAPPPPGGTPAPATPQGISQTPGAGAPPPVATWNAPGGKDMLRPTERPNEPITHGLPMGPGAGPEALTGFAAAGAQNNLNTNGTSKQLLQHLASQPAASSIIQTLAAS
jgi:hypothetical protein